MQVSDTKQARTWAMLCHLSALVFLLGVPFGNVMGPLLCWLLKREELPLVEEHGKASLNFQISVSIYTIAGMVLCITAPLVPIIIIAQIIYTILGAVKANQGELFDYPCTIEFIK